MYIAVNPTDIKANTQGGSHDPKHLLMDKEKNEKFSTTSEFGGK